jgi:hypothetical protein
MMKTRWWRGLSADRAGIRAGIWSFYISGGDVSPKGGRK